MMLALDAKQPVGNQLCAVQPSPWLQQRIDAAGPDVGPAVTRRVNEAADAVMPLRPPSVLATQLLPYLQPASSAERRTDVRLSAILEWWHVGSMAYMGACSGRLPVTVGTCPAERCTYLRSVSPNQVHIEFPLVLLGCCANPRSN